jgi:hypothetical protein
MRTHWQQQKSEKPIPPSTKEKKLGLLGARCLTSWIPRIPMASLVLHHFWPWQVYELWDMHAGWCSFILAG